ncbi:hypothetical protein L3Q82_003095 [Scortum barcoo]|uniref:Uncharacterized protein n=1 Tax=Scortum barcoo TaxID=214431 RepID=A0ACB8VR67_9TELE|nr:hypothetical protein L3Q82_003095 [Scortum barcoo]
MADVESMFHQDSVFWTDSASVLKYMRNETSRFKVFVAKRVSEIFKASKPSQWSLSLCVIFSIKKIFSTVHIHCSSVDGEFELLQSQSSQEIETVADDIAQIIDKIKSKNSTTTT